MPAPFDVADTIGLQLGTVAAATLSGGVMPAYEARKCAHSDTERQCQTAGLRVRLVVEACGGGWAPVSLCA